MRDKVFIDTNVIVYAHDDASPEKRDRAREILRAAVTNASATVSTQVLSEFYVTITKKVEKPLSSAAARREIGLLAALEVADVDVPMIDQAIEIHQRWQIGYWDALIIAAATRTGCATVLSEDLPHGRTYGSVTVRDPFAPAS